MKKFEFIEHTADLGIRVFGDSLSDLFKNAAYALFSLLIEEKTEESEKKEIKEKLVLEAEGLDELFVTWLNELISLFFIYNYLPLDYVLILEDKKDTKILKVDLKGEDVSIYSDRIIREIKAATYHHLQIKEDNGKYVAEVIFDV
ncbi:MAG: archease [Candidatus Omnitrophica bacterium]|nr:archease [Candidatus Omnitrophota bacterium]